MKNEMLNLLLLKYESRNNPKFISNREIMSFFNQYRNRINREDFLCIKNYFLSVLSAPRSVFMELEKRFTYDSIMNQGPEHQNIFLPARWKECEESLQLKRYSRRTITIYLSALRLANTWIKIKFNKTLDIAGQEDIRRYFLYLTNDKKASSSQVRIARFAVSYYFRIILKKYIDLKFVESLKESKHLPTVLTKSEIEAVVRSITNLKHRTIIALMYSSGLRLSELVNLRTGDIDLKALTIHVRGGKGNKDRVTIFSERLRDDIAVFMARKKADDYLFISLHKDSNGKPRPVSGRTVQKIFERALETAGVHKHATPHDLRHSFATHLLESGISIRYIQQLLGHKNISTTAVYTRVTNPDIKGIKSPF
jgi:integrase/recombinase XerD